MKKYSETFINNTDLLKHARIGLEFEFYMTDLSYYKTLELLNQYVDDLTRSGTLNGHNLKDAKHEQKRIMSEMNNIRRGLDKIIADTNDIETNLKEKNII